MTDQPRLHPDSIAALDAAVTAVVKPSPPTPPEHIFPLAEQSAEYERGWNDCRALILKTLGANP